METKQNLKVAEVKLSYKTTVKASERPQINSSMEVYNVSHYRDGFIYPSE